MVVTTHGYNTARLALIAAGSRTAQLSHPKHGGDAFPDSHGQSLLREARDEFNLLPQATRAVKRQVVVQAAATMGILNW